MFIVIYIRGDNLRDYRVVSYGHKTVMAAGQARKVSGDLVVDGRTGLLVRNKVWLFPWERKDQNSFAQRMLRKKY